MGKVIDLPQRSVVLEITCRHCDEPHFFNISYNQMKRLKAGKEPIQNILRNIDTDERELLISGICGSCWDNTIGKG
jgi:hypothetical protein